MRSHHGFFRRRWVTTGHPADGRAPAAARDDDTGPVTSGSQLAEETEAYLHGTLSELLAGQLRFLPPWVLVNRTAHGDVDELRRFLQGETPPVTIAAAPAGFSRAWAMAERSLVLRLVRSAVDPDDIRRIQREVLVPLELALVARSATESPTLGAVLADAVDALDQHRFDR